MTWAEKRKFTYMSVIVLVGGSIVFGMVHRTTSVAPTCFDNKKNGIETGVDCGGGCTNYCKNQLAEPKVLWVRSFEMTPGVVEAVAYIEHSYPTAAARQVQYQFKLYDETNTLITERSGTTFLGPMGQSAIVETLIPIGSAKPALTRFSFLPTVAWEKIPIEFSQVVIKADRNTLENFDGGTRLTATLENKSRYSFADLDMVAILYDDNGNAITVSKVVLPTLTGGETKVVTFTWPFILQTKVSRIEVRPRFNPFNARAL